jgi:signal transduction histidine kinase
MSSAFKKNGKDDLTFKQLIGMFVAAGRSSSKTNNLKLLIKELKKQVWILDTLVASSEDDIVLFDKNNQILFVNNFSKRKLKSNFNIAVGKAIDEFNLSASQKNQLKDDLNKVFEENKPLRNSIVFNFGSKQSTVEYIFTPVLDENGKSKFVLTVGRDISEHVASNRELEVSKQVVETILENLGDGVNVFTADGQLCYTNELGIKLLGYVSRNEIKPNENIHKILKRRWKKYLVYDEFSNPFPIERSPVLVAFKNSCIAEATVCLIDKKTQKEMWFLLKARPVFNSDGSINMIVNTYTDLSYQKRYEKDLYRTKNQLDVIFQNVADGIIVYDQDGKLVFANDMSWKLLEFNNKSEMLKKKNIHNLVNYVCNDLRGLDENNSPLTVNHSPTLKVLNGETVPVFIMHIFNPTNKKDSWLSLRSRPVYNENNKIKMVVNLLSDITEQKELEKRKDEFIGVVSHELKTPLTSIKAFAQILEKKSNYIGRPTLSKYLSEMNFQINRFQDLVMELLDASKFNTGKLELNRETFEVCPFIENILHEFSKVHLNYQFVYDKTENITILADKTRVSQVLINLLSNAVKYSNKSKKIIIRSFKKQDKVIFSVQDFGLGVPKHEQDKIFSRFYQIRHYRQNQDPSLGLGLYISSQIISLHGGKMWLKSKLNHGSTFSFSLPVKKKTLKNEKSTRI